MPRDETVDGLARDGEDGQAVVQNPQPAPPGHGGEGTKTSRGSLNLRWLAPAMGVYLGAWMVRRMWGAGLIGGADSTAITARTDRTS